MWLCFPLAPTTPTATQPQRHSRCTRRWGPASCALIGTVTSPLGGTGPFAPPKAQASGRLALIQFDQLSRAGLRIYHHKFT